MAPWNGVGLSCSSGQRWLDYFISWSPGERMLSCSLTCKKITIAPLAVSEKTRVEGGAGWWLQSSSAVCPSCTRHKEDEQVSLLPLMTPRETQEVSGEEEGSVVLQQGEEVERSES